MFNLKAANGEVILTSELYEDKQSAVAGIESVSRRRRRYSLRTQNRKEGQTFFVLKATNGQTIGKSEMYSSGCAMDNGIQSVKKNGGRICLSRRAEKLCPGL